MSGPTKHLNSEMHRGIVPTDQLGSGSATSATFLRGDQTWATPAGGSSSFGSNSNSVGSANAPGASSSNAHADHVHQGVHEITSNGSNALFGDVNVAAGSGIAITQSGQNLTIAATGTVTGGGSGTLTTIKDEGSTLSSAAVSVDFVGAGVTATNVGTAVTVTIPGGSTDPVASIFGTPDTAYEFASSSLAGLTAIGSPTTENANTTIPDCLYYKDSSSGTAWMGRYQAAPSFPFTAIAKLLDFNARDSFNNAGLLLGVADPTTGAFITMGVGASTNAFTSQKWTNRTTFNTGIGSDAHAPVFMPVYVAFVANSTSSVDMWWSLNGWVWRKHQAAYNPSLTLASIGLSFKSENSNGAAVAFDYLRIWNSAKTFPGI